MIRTSRMRPEPCWPWQDAMMGFEIAKRQSGPVRLDLVVTTDPAAQIWHAQR
jgi:hypothetical protein